jgi:signal transduction histidine kinase
MSRARRPLQLAVVLILALVAALTGAMTLMRAPPGDLELLAVFLVASGALTLAVAGGVVRWVGLRLSTMRGRLAVASTAGVLIALVNVLATSALMFLSPHDLGLLVLLLAFAGVISLAFGYVTAGSLTAQLERVSRTAERLAEGDLDARVQTHGKDEAARLGLAFDRMADRLQRAFERERALEANRRDLVTAVSHDLRTPLATTRAMVEAITDRVVTEPREIDRYLGLIGREIQHLSRLIDDLFELNQIESGLLTLRLDVVQVSELIASVKIAYDQRAAAGGVQLEVLLASGAAEASVLGDADRLQRVLRNLLDNALRHTPGGGLIRVEAEVSDSSVTVSVADSGPGIPLAERERVFDRSYRGLGGEAQGEARRETGAGAGLGLAIARGLVQAHHGHIWAESSTLGGAALRFWLPTATAEVVSRAARR